MNIEQQFMAWAARQDLSHLSPQQRTKPVLWYLPDVVTEPIFFKDFSIYRAQHTIKRDETLEMARVRLEDWVMKQQGAFPAWLTHPSLSEFANRLRCLLWLIMELNPPLSDPRMQTYRYVVNHTSLLAQFTPRCTMGYHGGTWGTWETTLERTLTIAPDRYAKSPNKALREAKYTPIAAPVDNTWADAIYNAYLYFGLPPYGLVQLLAQFRLTHPHALQLHKQDLTLEDLL